MKSLTILTLLVITSLLLAACGTQATPASQPTATEAPMPAATAVPEPTSAPTEAPVLPDTSTKDIVDIAVEDGRFTTLVAAVKAANLVDTLKSAGPFTVFAPTDDAFAKLPAGTVEGLLNDIPALTDILLYHVVPGKVMASDVVKLDGENAPTALKDQTLAIAVDGEKVMLNGTTQVIITDIQASNGIIHVIDTVLLPPAEETSQVEPMETATEEPMAEVKDIVDTAVADGRFTTLVAAVQAAGLVETLKGEGPFTVFAPTDEAFALLPAGTVEGLLKDIPALTNILLYHVVPGKVMAADVLKLDGQQAATALEGQSISIQIDGDKVILNESVQVIITDIEVSNGVIHVIDAVLLPTTP